MQEEEWRPAVGYEGLYEVSSWGRVRTCLKILSPGKTGPLRKHLAVCLTKNKKSRMERVHVLVLEAFGGRRPPGLVCRHLDGDGFNNRPENLAWGTHTENALDRQRHGTDAMTNRTHCPKNHPYEGDNLRVVRGGKARECRACHQESNRRYRARKVS